MFIGHFAVGLAAKRAAPRTSIGTLTLAAVFLAALSPPGVGARGDRAGSAQFLPLSELHLLPDLAQSGDGHRVVTGVRVRLQGAHPVRPRGALGRPPGPEPLGAGFPRSP